MENKISQRLKQVAGFVPHGAKLLDVGSDHAYLPIYLIESGVIEEAIAGEVVKGPYQSAVDNVALEGLTDAIEVRLANGLDAFSREDGVTAIVVAGMGGRLIADILEAGKDKLSTVERLILQPNNNEDHLRQWLVANGFALTHERIMAEAGKRYEMLVAEHGQQELDALDIQFGPFLRQEKNDVFRAKWQFELDTLNRILEKIPETQANKRADALAMKAMIEEVLTV
jgi:tRNA (adenine22-N1)-methyltransferase